MPTTNIMVRLHNSTPATTRPAHPGHEQGQLGPSRHHPDPRDLSRTGINTETAEHYRNLTRGLLCGPPGAMVLRIQWTHCEQHLWEQLLWQIPDQLLWDLAHGRTVIVHDRSERDRETRAMWQGLQLVRIVTETAWFGHPNGNYEFTRGGTSAYQYLSAVAAALPRPLRKRFSYFRQRLAPAVSVAGLHSCYQLDTHSPRPHPLAMTSVSRGHSLR